MFYLIRHGEPNWQLSLDLGMTGFQANFVGLTERGISQIDETAKNECLKDAELIISSPYPRALQTGQILSRRLNKDLRVEFGLHEWLMDVNLNYPLDPALMEQFQEEYFRYRGIPQEGCKWEPADCLRRRALETLGRYSEYSKVIVTCHEIVIRTLTGKDSVNFGEIVPFSPEF